jgi:ketosteroid isomerase-like protein
MTSSGVEFVRSIIASWEHGGYSSSGWADPEIELVIADGPEPGVWTGRAGLAAAAREFLSPLADTRVHADELRELGDDRVLALLSYTGRGKASGLEVDARMAKGAWLFHVVDGRVTRVVRYWDRDHALADLGLAPKGDTTD